MQTDMRLAFYHNDRTHEISVYATKQTDHFEIAQRGVVSIGSGISSQREAESAVNLDRPVVVTGHGQLQSSRTLGTSPGNYCIDQLAADSKPPVARRDPHGHQMCPA